MNELIKIEAPAGVTMSSLELVEFINSQRKQGEATLQHKHFLTKVPQVLGEEGSAKFSATYIHPQNGQTYPCYRFPKREACLMAMSYSYELQAKVFDRMTELEGRARIPSMPELLRQHADALEKLEQQSALIEKQKPSVEFVGKYVDATGTFGFRQVCKLLEANENEFREFLFSKGIIYRLNGVLTPKTEHIRAGRFDVKTGMNDKNNHSFTQMRFTAKGVQWIAGMWIAEQQINSAVIAGIEETVNE